MRKGFTLIELLVVIAIIAILAAILYAAFGPAKEAPRKATAMENLHSIDVGLERYKLDHDGNYPPVLFAYQDSATPYSMKNISSDSNPAVLQGLYPQYVKSVEDFLDPDNSDIDDTSSAHTQLPTTRYNRQTATYVPETDDYFNADSFDVSPQVTGNNQVNKGSYVVRYLPQWTQNITPAPTAATFPGTTIGNDGISFGQYQRQISLPDVNGDTYVTCTTYHVPQLNKVIVLFKDGSTKVVDTTQFLSAQGGTDATNVSFDAAGVSKARFWTITPNGTWN